MKQKKGEAIVYLDLDDVLVDWTGRVIAMGQERYGLPRYSSDSDREYVSQLFTLNMHQLIDLEGPEWWESLPPMPCGLELLDLVKDLKAKCEIQDWFIVTNPTNFLHSYEGKRRWLLKHTGCAHKHVITSSKHLLAKPSTILVDDLIENCTSFEHEGGRAFWYPPRSILYSPEGKSEILNVADAIAKLCKDLEHGIS